MNLRMKNGKIWGLVYIAPVILFISVYMIYPIMYNIFYSLYDWNGIGADKIFLGAGNYLTLFNDPIFITIIKNFFIYGIITVFLQAFLGLLLAIFLKGNFLGRDLSKTIIFMPAVLSSVVIGNVFFRILEPNNGYINMILRAIGLDFLAKQWLADINLALWVVIVVQIWQWTGYSMTMYYAGLKAIPVELYEAAKIDGASPFQIFTKIDIQLLRSTTYGLTILGAIGVLKQFELVWTLTRGGPANSTQFFSTYMFRVTFDLFKQGYASAIAMVMFVVALIITVVQLRMYSKNQVEY